MEDVLSVYERPFDPKRPVVCLDEKTKELHSSPRGRLGLQPDRPVREDYEYDRNGTCNIFLSVEPLRGWRRVTVTARKTARDFAEELKRLVDEDYADAECVVLVTDNLKTHDRSALYERFAPDEAKRIADKIEWHFTPEHGSWLNMAEIELSVLGRQCLDRRIEDEAVLRAEVDSWQTERNAMPVRIDWQFTTSDARIKLKRLYPEIKPGIIKLTLH